MFQKSTALAILLCLLLAGISLPQSPGRNAKPNPNAIAIARLKYPGGGDWYWGNSALPNLIDFIKKNTSLNIADQEVVLDINDEKLFSYPFLYMTGHGNVNFSDKEASRLEKFLTGGGFLFANDSYGMDQAFRREMKKIFPSDELVELPFDHPVYHSFFDFPNGLPKIHKHDGKPAQGFGIIHQGRLVVFYAYESDIADGWEDPQVHNDPPEKREAALKMGVNILVQALVE
ncbi:MAG: DUF4159 domain-containing protein [candidate division Zixibacteria bacterium]|nr:DUF4159 domain-containing protein [candidate division Zixibacteria bacterium]